MNTRRSFIGITLSAIAGCFAGIPKLFTRSPKDKMEWDGSAILVGPTDGKFGHWICERDVYDFGDVRVDGYGLAVVEANDIEGWARIDIDAAQETGESTPIFHGNWPQAIVFGKVTIGAGALGCSPMLPGHQRRMLEKTSTIFLPPRALVWSGCVPFRYGDVREIRSVLYVTDDQAKAIKSVLSKGYRG